MFLAAEFTLVLVEGSVGNNGVYMPLFEYKARDKKGSLVTGDLEGESAISIKEALASQGLFPVSVQPKGFERSLAAFFERPLKPRELLSLTRQFQVMFSVGTPMDKILATLARQAKHEGLKAVLKRIHQDIESGVRLSEAFAKHPKYFDALYTSMLQVGETGGVLEKVLTEMTTILEKESRIRAKIKSATLYPRLAIGAVLVVSVLMLIFVIPAFEAFYAKYHSQLPLPTRIMIGLSEFASTYWYLFLLGVGGIFYGIKMFFKTAKGELLASLINMKLPVFGNLNRLVADARFGHLLAALYRAGLPLSQTLEVVANTIDNKLYANDVRSLRKEIDSGVSMSVAMERYRYFSPLMVETAAVGEQTGNLDTMLEATATYYDEEIDDILRNLSTLIEPLLLLVVFGMVALLALAIFLPIWNLSSVI